jgi:SPP1 gp7 family putative phage head morphogenesis protein
VSSNQFLIDAASRHAVFLQRYSAGLERDAALQVREALNAVLRLLEASDISQLSGSQFGSLQFQVMDVFEEKLAGLSSDLIDELTELMEAEADFTVSMLEQGTKAAIAMPAPQQLELALNLIQMDVEPALGINESLNKFGRAKTEQVRQVIKDAYTEGLTSQKAIARVKQIIPLQARQASSLVRTATNATSSSSRMQVMLENSDIFDGYEWVSTLDGRTSHICMARDGKIYPFKSTSPRPPAHWACRSTIIPKVKPEYDLLSEVEGIRPSSSGEVGAKTTYGGWLRKQTKSFQEEVLGEARAKLFRDGGLKIDAFVDDSGRVYTLQQLRALNPLAFEQAGI